MKFVNKINSAINKDKSYMICKKFKFFIFERKKSSFKSRTVFNKIVKKKRLGRREAIIKKSYNLLDELKLKEMHKLVNDLKISFSERMQNKVAEDYLNSIIARYVTEKFKSNIKKSSYADFIIRVKKTISNIFITVTSYRTGKTYFVLSSGMFRLRGKRRFSVEATRYMTKKLVSKLNRLKQLVKPKIFRLTFMLYNLRFNYVIKGILHGVIRANYKFKSIVRVLKKPHNGIRRRALKRKLSKLIYVGFIIAVTLYNNN